MKAPRPRLFSAPRGKSAPTRIRRTTAAAIKATIVDDFTSLDNLVVLSGAPVITAGRLSGSGFAVRHRDQAASDDYKVTAVVGERNVGKTWLVTCASESFDRFYAVEIDTQVVGGTISIVKGTGLQQTKSTDLFGVILGLVEIFLESLSDLFYAIARWAQIPAGVDNGDVIDVWWDQDASIIRAYRNGFEVTNLLVPAWEIPHGDGFRYFGVVTSPDALGGVEFTSIKAQDV